MEPARTPTTTVLSLCIALTCISLLQLVTATCVVSTLNLTNSWTQNPILTVGPYFVDQKTDVKDIRQDRTGATLNIDFTVYNVTDDSCRPIPGAAIDLWHADGNGKYSNEQSESTLGSTWLRGYHIADANGKVSFVTIYPGWYSGRTVHMHTRLRLMDASGSTIYDQNTQLFFDDTLTDSVYSSTAPYNTRSTRDTRNAKDNIYTSATNIPLVLSGNAADGFYTSVPIFYPLGTAGAAGPYNAPYSSSGVSGAAAGASATSSGAAAGSSATSSGAAAGSSATSSGSAADAAAASSSGAASSVTNNVGANTAAHVAPINSATCLIFAAWAAAMMLL